MTSALEILAGYLMGAVALAFLVLRWRDRRAKEEGRTPGQVHAGFQALLQLRSTIYRAAPGLLLIALGMYSAVSGYYDGNSEWWYLLLLIPFGWALVIVMTRKSWRRYLELRRFADEVRNPLIKYKPIE
jgi:hypothetical protein